MGAVVNLRTARKAKARVDREAVADRNRVAHGLPKAERERLAAERRTQALRLDGHRRDGPDRDR